MAEAIQAFQARVNTHLDEIGAAVDGIVLDVAELKRIITELQNSPGTVTPADQASLDALETRITGLSAKVKELDATTAPAEVPVPA